MGNLVTETPYSEITATLELLDCLGVDRDGLKNFRKTSSYLQLQVARLMQEGEEKPTSDSTPIIIVDYILPLNQMIAAGRYNWHNDNITAKRFPINGVGKVEMETKLFHFNRDISSENANRLIQEDDKTNPWEPAKIEHILFYGAKNPEEQRKYPIIGLGSVAEVSGGRVVPCLRRTGVKRLLYLGWWDRGWGSFYRFLAVRKKVS